MFVFVYVLSVISVFFLYWLTYRFLCGLWGLAVLTKALVSSINISIEKPFRRSSFKCLYREGAAAESSEGLFGMKVAEA